MSHSCRTENCQGTAQMQGGWCQSCKDMYAPKKISDPLTFEQKMAKLRDRVRASMPVVQVEQFDMNTISEQELHELFADT